MVLIHIHQQRNPDLAEIALTPQRIGGPARRVEGGEKDRDQHRNDSDHDQEFNEGKPTNTPRSNADSACVVCECM